MSNVTKFYAKDAAKNPDAVLEQAVGELDSVFVVGYNKNGDIDMRVSTNTSPADVVFMLESAKLALMDGWHWEEE